MTTHWRGRAARAMAAMAVVALLSTSCSGGAEGSGSTSSTPSPTPTPASVLWADDVCVQRDNVKASVSSLGRNLSYDVTADRSALEQIDRQLRLQALAVADATDRLLTTLSGVPVDFVAANDFVEAVTKSGTDARDAATEVSSRLENAMNAGTVIEAGVEMTAAVVAAKAAFEAGQVFVSTLSDATSSANGELQDAFAAAPACQSS